MYPVFYRQPRIIYTVAMTQNLFRQALFAGLFVAITGCDLAGKELRFLVAEHRQFSPAKLAEILGLTEKVRAIPIVDPEVTHSIGLVVPQRNPLTPLINALVTEAKQLF